MKAVRPFVRCHLSACVLRSALMMLLMKTLMISLLVDRMGRSVIAATLNATRSMTPSLSCSRKLKSVVSGWSYGRWRTRKRHLNKCRRHWMPTTCFRRRSSMRLSILVVAMMCRSSLVNRMYLVNHESSLREKVEYSQNIEILG